MSDSTPAQRILVVGPSWVGDMVMAQSLFKTLQQQNPAHLIDVVAPAWSVPVLQRMPEINEAIVLPVKHKEFALLRRYRLGRSLRGRHYDRAITLPRSYKSALLPFFAGVTIRSGYRGEMRYGLLNNIHVLDKSILKQTVQRYVALAGTKSATCAPDIPSPRLTVNADNQAKVLATLGLSTRLPIIGMMPGAEYGPAKQWPVHSFQQLARDLVAKGYQVWVFGSEKDHGAAAAISTDSSQIHNLCGKTQLADVIDLIALCKYCVTNDSGLMHVACAVDVPVIAIYGSSTPDYTPPLSPRAQVVYLGLACSPCFERVCPLGHTNCLNDIQPMQIAAMINNAGEVQHG